MLRQLNLATSDNLRQGVKNSKEKLSEKMNFKRRGNNTAKRRKLMRGRNLRDRANISRNNNESKFRSRREQTRIGKVVDFKRDDSFELKSPVRSEQLVISSKFGEQRDGHIHKGIDIDGEPGEQIYAANEGEVVFSEETEQGGKEVIINHDNGLKTKYSHLDSINVEEGDRVTTETVLGEMGNTGEVQPSDEDSCGTHLHYEVMKDGKHLDPESFLEEENVEHERGDYGNSFTLSSCSGGSSGSSGSCGGNTPRRNRSRRRMKRDLELRRKLDEAGTCSSTGTCSSSGNNNVGDDNNVEEPNSPGDEDEISEEYEEISNVSFSGSNTWEYDSTTITAQGVVEWTKNIAGYFSNMVSIADDVYDLLTESSVSVDPEAGAELTVKTTIEGKEEGEIRVNMEFRYEHDTGEKHSGTTKEIAQTNEVRTYKYSEERSDQAGEIILQAFDGETNRAQSFSIDEIKERYNPENYTSTPNF